MTIFNLITKVRIAFSPRCRGLLTYRLGAIVLALGLMGAASASDAPASKGESAKTTAAATTATSSADGNVLRNGIRMEDAIEVVNTRGISNGCNADSVRDGLKFESYAICNDAGDRKWQSSDLKSFLAFDPSVPTVIFIHGNQITPGEAKSEGLSVYRKVILQDPNAPRIRFVIFSWPSSKTRGLLRDVREKAARTEPAGYQLAWLLNQMPAETPVSLVGFSFGARIITGGLHVLAGGSLGGSLKLAEQVHPHRAPVNAVLIAAASNSYWLAEGQHHGLAMSLVNRVLFINNCADRAMRYYDLLTPGRGGPQAMGLCGPTRVNRKDADKIFNRDVSRYVGATHDLMAYICAPGDPGLIWDYSGPAAKADAKIGG